MERYALDPGAGVLLHDLGVSPGNVMDRAGLPRDLLSRGPVALAPPDYFAFWRGLREETGDPDLPLRIVRALSVEVFTPPLFAALCSPDLSVAAARIATYKRLIGPLRVEIHEEGTALTLECLWPGEPDPPRVLVLTELLYWVALTRIATRHEVRPLRVRAPRLPDDPGPYADYLGVEPERGTTPSVTFSARDAGRPFLTANAPMWNFFEPELRRRLALVTRQATTAERVRAALLDMLPAGRGTMTAVAGALAVSPRTLQRRLRKEDTSFQTVLTETRRSLARHYLSDGGLTTESISFLLGYDDAKSFHRAFRGWTGGLTPARARTEPAGDGSLAGTAGP